MAEKNTPQPNDAAGECCLYYKSMTRVYIADAKPEERFALRLLLLDLSMEVVGEAADWPTTLANAPATRLDMLLVDWALLPVDQNVWALAKLRLACPKAVVVVLLSHLAAHQQAALSACGWQPRSSPSGRCSLPAGKNSENMPTQVCGR
jgi:hypothetical protein